VKIEVKVTGRLPDIDDHWIDVSCPRCPLTTEASLRDVRLGNVIICRGCKANIRLVDHLGEYHRARRRLADSLNSLLNAFKR
jgi:hypothetical protein